MEMNRNNDEMKKCVAKEMNRSGFNEYDHSNVVPTSSNNINNSSNSNNLYERKETELKNVLEKQVEFVEPTKNDQKCNYKKKHSIWYNKNTLSPNMYSQNELYKNGTNFKTSDVEDCVVSSNAHTKLHFSHNSVSNNTSSNNNNSNNSNKSNNSCKSNNSNNSNSSNTCNSNNTKNSMQCSKDSRSNLSPVEEHLNNSSKNVKNENERANAKLFNPCKSAHENILPCLNEKKINSNQNYISKRSSNNTNNSHSNSPTTTTTTTNNNNNNNEKVMKNTVNGNQNNNDTTKLKGMNLNIPTDKKCTAANYSFKDNKNKKLGNYGGPTSGSNDSSMINHMREGSGKIENEPHNKNVSSNRERSNIFGETNGGRGLCMTHALVESSHTEGNTTKVMVNEGNRTLPRLESQTSAFSESGRKHKGGVERREGSRRKEKTPYSIPADKYLNVPGVSHYSNEHRISVIERDRNPMGVTEEESANKKKKSYQEIIKRACSNNDPMETNQNHINNLLNNHTTKNLGSSTVTVGRNRKVKNLNSMNDISSRELKPNVKAGIHSGNTRDVLLMKPNITEESEEHSLNYGKANEPKNTELMHIKLQHNTSVVGTITTHNTINENIFKEAMLAENDLSFNENVSFLNIDSSLNTWEFKPLPLEESQKRESKANSVCSSNESIFDEIRKFSNRSINFQDSFYDFPSEEYRNPEPFNNVLSVEENNRIEKSRLNTDAFNMISKNEGEDLRFDVNELLKGEKEMMVEINRMSTMNTKNIHGVSSGCEITGLGGSSFECSNSKNHLNGLPTVTNITQVNSLQSMNSFNSSHNMNRLSSGSNESNVPSNRVWRVSKNDTEYIKYKGEQTREFLSNPNFSCKNVFQESSKFENTNPNCAEDPWINNNELSFIKKKQAGMRSSCNTHKTNSDISIARNRNYKEHVERNKINISQEPNGDMLEQPRKNLCRNNVHPYHSKGNQGTYGLGSGRRRNCDNTNDLLSKDMNIDPIFFTNMKYEIFPYDNEVIPTDTQTNEYFLGVTTDSLLNHPYKESEKSSSECESDSVKKKDATKDEGINTSVGNEKLYQRKNNYEEFEAKGNNNKNNSSTMDQKVTSEVVRNNDAIPWFDNAKNKNRNHLFESEADVPENFTGLPITRNMKNLMDQPPIIKCVNTKEPSSIDKNKVRKNGSLEGKDINLKNSLSPSEHRYYDLFGSPNNTHSEEELVHIEAKSPVYNQTNGDKIYSLNNEANIWNTKIVNRVDANGVKSGHTVRETPTSMEKNTQERRSNYMSMKTLLDNRDSAGKMSNSSSSQVFKANDEAYIQKHLRSSIHNKVNTSMEGGDKNSVPKELQHGRANKDSSTNRTTLNYPIDVSANHDKINEMQNIINDLQTQNQKLERELDYVKRMYLKKKQSQILSNLSNNREVISTYSSYKEDSCDSDDGSVAQSKKYMQHFLEEQKRYEAKVPIQKFQLAYTSNSIGKLKIAAQRDISGSFMGPKGIHVKTIKSSLHISVYKSAKDVWFPGFADSHVFLLKGNIFGILRACQLLYHYVKSKMSYSKCCIYLVAPFECVQKLLADGCKRMATIKEECGADVRLGNLYVQVNEGFTERLMEIRGNECSVDSALEKLVIFMQSCFSVQSCDYELLKYPCRSVLNLP